MAQAADNPLRARFARRLRLSRVPRGYQTARMFAQALQIDENRYTRYERGEVEPDLAMLVRICMLLGLTPNDLLGFPEAGPSPAPTGFSDPGPSNAECGLSQAPHVPVASTTSTAGPRALAWQIACRVTEQQMPGTPGVDALTELCRTLEVFTQIEADPFGFVARATADPALAAMPPEPQAELVAVMKSLLSAVGGGPAPPQAPRFDRLTPTARMEGD